MEVSEIAPGVFVHQGRYEMQSPENQGDMANAGIVVGSDAVAVIDTLGSFKVGERLRNAVRAVTDKPIRYVINTHMHPDHVFGNAAFKEDAPAFVANHKLARGLASRAERYLATNKRMLGDAAFAGIEVILPTVPVDNTMSLDLGGRTAQEVALSILAEIVQSQASQARLLPVEPAVAPATSGIDPVCGMSVEIAMARHVAEVDGASYYFCCAQCRVSFLANPQAYLARS